MAGLVREAPACLAYGGDETFGSLLKARGAKPLFGGGHMESFVIVFRDAMSHKGDRRLARAIARDCAVYDQSGCLSPNVALVESGGQKSPFSLARDINDELLSLAGSIPPGRVSVEEAALLRVFAEESRVLARGSGGAVFGPDSGVTPLVSCLPGSRYRQGPGMRTLQVIPFEGEPDLHALIPSIGGRVQGIAVAGDIGWFERTMSRFPEYRANHVCAPGRLQRPPAVWPENGIVLTRELARLFGG